MDTKVTVNQMVSAIGTMIVNNDGLRAHGLGYLLVNLDAARYYILSAESQITELNEALAHVVKELEQYSLPTHPSMSLPEKVRYRIAETHFAIEHDRKRIAERDARIANTEHMLRKEWWLNHRCPISTAYGDDGEMQCNAACCRKDFKREPLEVLLAHVSVRRLAKAKEDMTLLEEAHAQIVEMQKVTSAINSGDLQAIVNACGECETAAQVEQDSTIHCERHDYLFAALDALGLTEANDGK